MVKLRVQPIEAVGDNLGRHVEGPLWDSVQRVQTLANEALPNFQCPICQSPQFTLVRDFDTKASPRLNLQSWTRNVVTSFMPTLVLACDECGYVVQFATDELQKRAERRKRAYLGLSTTLRQLDRVAAEVARRNQYWNSVLQLSNYDSTRWEQRSIALTPRFFDLSLPSAKLRRKAASNFLI